MICVDGKVRRIFFGFGAGLGYETGFLSTLIARPFRAKTEVTTAMMQGLGRSRPVRQQGSEFELVASL
jgi:hypothetical protein